MSTQVNQRDFESEKRLRKDLKRTKALLADAQIMLDHLKNNAPSKREIAQLKNQVPADRKSSAFSLSLLPLSVVLESSGREVTGKWGEARLPRVCVCYMHDCQAPDGMDGPSIHLPCHGRRCRYTHNASQPWGLK